MYQNCQAEVICYAADMHFEIKKEKLQISLNQNFSRDESHSSKHIVHTLIDLKPSIDTNLNCDVFFNQNSSKTKLSLTNLYTPTMITVLKSKIKANKARLNHKFNFSNRIIKNNNSLSKKSDILAQGFKRVETERFNNSMTNGLIQIIKQESIEATYDKEDPYPTQLENQPNYNSLRRPKRKSKWQAFAYSIWSCYLKSFRLILQQKNEKPIPT